MLLIITIQPDGKITLTSDDQAATAKAFELLRERLHLAAEDWVRGGQIKAMRALAGEIDERDQTMLKHLGFAGFAFAIVWGDEASGSDD